MTQNPSHAICPSVPWYSRSMQPAGHLPAAARRAGSFAVAAMGIALALLGVVPQRSWAVEIIAHRGASYQAPENTLASVRLAWEEDADAVEIDVWQTADGRIVVIHDEKLDRTTGRSGKVSQWTLNELQQLDAGAWKGPAWEGERIPTLEAVLATVPAGRRLFVEVKCGPEIVEELRRVVEASGKRPAQIVIISFNLAVVEAAKEKMPQLEAYWIRGTSPRRDRETGQWIDRPDELLEICRQAGLNGLDLAYDSQLTREYVERLHRLGLKLYVWTVNAPEDARRLAALGVDGITTDRPGWLRRQLGASPVAD